VRTSASSMMRKLSVASIAGSLTKRSTGLSSPGKEEEEEHTHVTNFIDSLVTLNCDLSQSSPEIGGRGLDEERQRLPSIQDKPEQESHSELILETAIDRRAPCGTCAKQVEQRSRPATPDAAYYTETADLDSAAANTVRIRLPPRTFSGSVSMASLEKENVRRTSPELKQAVDRTSERKARGKWNKINALHRGHVGERLRNIFR
jgi:hypothetical protein